MVRGLQHKYQRIALLLVNDFCSAYCRFCFRKRFTLGSDIEHHIQTGDEETVERETTFDVSEGVAYIAAHPEIDTVLITGGDPLMLAPSRLRRVLEQVSDIPHLRIVRIGTKVPAFEPARITGEMFDTLEIPSRQGKQVYLMVHYNHPRELTEASLEVIAEARRRGFGVYNQTPLLRGINDDVDTLVELLNGLITNGIVSYYLFHCRPTIGNEAFMMTFQEGNELVRQTRARVNGLARAFHYTGSHETGKIEIVGVDNDNLVFRYHQARDPADEGRVMTWPVDQPISWYDDVLERNKTGDVNLNESWS